MSPDPAVSGPVRPAAVVNEDIRRLARAAWGRPYASAEPARYNALLAEWAAADRARILPAA
ncbi:hypothetical protein FRZ03_04225 [Streptomyces misionensis]|uniref:Uncharacterized protein n=1 Tax=Streptomyces misionensis TaxID=67331 RepID=A0A5C6K1T3_9ACTN|nr:hypothetical protein FRZ03_04225 [Streptomyces misionensis]